MSSVRRRPAAACAAVKKEEPVEPVEPEDESEPAASSEGPTKLCPAALFFGAQGFAPRICVLVN